MWLWESLAKELLYRWLASALRVGVVEGVYLDAASGNQRLLFNLQEAQYADGGYRIKTNRVLFIPHIAIRKKANQL